MSTLYKAGWDPSSFSLRCLRDEQLLCATALLVQTQSAASRLSPWPTRCWDSSSETLLHCEVVPAKPGHQAQNSKRKKNNKRKSTTQNPHTHTIRNNVLKHRILAAWVVVNITKSLSRINIYGSTYAFLFQPYPAPTQSVGGAQGVGADAEYTTKTTELMQTHGGTSADIKTLVCELLHI